MFPELQQFISAASNIYSDSERVGASRRQEHLRYLEEAKTKLLSYAKPETQELAEAMYIKYEEQYSDRLSSLLSTESGIASCWQVGRANFPVARMEKRRDVASRKSGELLEWCESRLNRLCTILKQKVALPRLEQLKIELTQAELEHNAKLAVNKWLRKTKEPTYDGLVQLLQSNGITTEQVESVAYSASYVERYGFRLLFTTNGNARIKRLKDNIMLEERRLAKAAGTPQKETMFRGVRVVEDHEENRLRLHFPARISDAQAQQLSRSGWKWSRTNQAWQRQLTNNAIYAANQFLRTLPKEEVAA